MKVITYLQALIRARELIARGDYEMICVAICKAANERHHGLKPSDAILSIEKMHTSRIMNQLGSSLTYFGWVQRRHPEVFHRMIKLRDAAIYPLECPFRQGRLQWLDHMIAEERAAKGGAA